MVRQCARFVFFDAFLIFLITQAEEELKYKLAGGHDCRNYKGTEENSVFGREGLCDIRDKSLTLFPENVCGRCKTTRKQVFIQRVCF